MLKTTVGQLLINSQLPPKLRDYTRVLDKGGIQKLMTRIAQEHPDDYREIAQKLANVGRDSAYSTGGFSFGLKHMLPARATVQMRHDLDRELESIGSNESLDDEAKRKAIILAVGSRLKPLEDAIYDESIEERNPLALQILSGTRGNKMNLKSIRGGDLLYTDHHNNPIPVPVVRSYAEGLSPVEYFAGAFGARKGVVDVKRGVADSGFFGKQLIQAAHQLIVTDHDEPESDTPRALRGMPVSVHDMDNEGALLAMPVGPYSRNTVLTPRILKELAEQGHDRILVRSPIIGGPPQGGVYARDVGMREKATLPPVGDYVGIAAAQALAEKLTQGGLSSKHSGGVAGASQSVSGFQYVNSLVQVPKSFSGGATHAQVDGVVSSIEPAPQGGHIIKINNEEHYVPAGQGVKVKPHGTVEAGDILSDGVPNPAEVVKHKGLGEGRRYFVDAFRDAYSQTGMNVHRRNIELLARGLIDHVQLDDEVGDYVPDDVVPYSSIERDWTPRQGTIQLAPRAAGQKYLESPVLHYSIGTKIKPSVIKDLEHFGIDRIDVHNEAPPFSPVMIRGLASLQHSPDFLTRHLGSNLQKSTLDAVHRGGSSNPAGTSYVSALAGNPTGFGTEGLTQGWRPKSLIPG